MAETAADAGERAAEHEAGRGGRAGGEPRAGSEPVAGRARGAGAGGAGGVAAAGRGGDATEPDVDELPSDTFLWFAADHAEANAAGAVLEWKSLGNEERIARAAGSDTAPKLVTVEQRKWLAFEGDAELVLPSLPPISAASFFAVVNADRAADELHCPSLLHFANRAASSVVQTARIEFGRHMAELLYQVNSKEYTPAFGSGRFPSDGAHLLSVIHGSDRLLRLKVDAKQIREPEMADLPEAVERGFNYIGHNHYYANNMPYCQAFKGRIGEMLFFSRGVSDEERERIERYLSAKWGVTAARP